MRRRFAEVKASGLTMRPPFGSPKAAVRAPSISRALRVGVTVSLTPNECARGSIDCTNFSAKGPASGLKINAQRPSSGAISLMSSNHLAPIANSKLVNPVMLPPGRAKLETKPCPIGSPTTTNTIGIVLVSFRTAVSDNHVRLLTDQLCSIGLCSGCISPSPSIVDMDVTSLGPTEFAKSLPKQSRARLPVRIVLTSRYQHADPPQPFGLLRPRRERPC